MNERYKIGKKKIKVGFFKYEDFYYVYSGLVPEKEISHPAFFDLIHPTPGLNAFNYYEQAKAFGAQEIKVKNGYDIFFPEKYRALMMIEWLEGLRVAGTLAGLNNEPEKPRVRTIRV